MAFELLEKIMENLSRVVVGKHDSIELADHKGNAKITERGPRPLTDRRPQVAVMLFDQGRNHQYPQTQAQQGRGQGDGDMPDKEVGQGQDSIRDQRTEQKKVYPSSLGTNERSRDSSFLLQGSDSGVVRNGFLHRLR